MIWMEECGWWVVPKALFLTDTFASLYLEFANIGGSKVFILLDLVIVR